VTRFNRTSYAVFMTFASTVYASGGAAHSTEGAKRFRASYYVCVDKAEGVTAALNDCIGAEYDFQDRRLNAAYQALRKGMDDAAKNVLRDDERAWIASRDKSCAAAEDGGTAALLDSNQCELKETAERATELESRKTSSAYVRDGA
jgi:uncharacterized protein YecT (DUF1311 family)